MRFTARALAGPVAVPPAYAAAAKAKLKRDRESYAAFRRADQEEHDRAHRQRVAAAAADAEEEVRLWHLELAEREPEAAEALAGFRAAEDRAREAREYARQQLAAYEFIAGKGSAEEETGARIRADAADETAANAVKVMEEKQAGLAGADQLLAEARVGLAGAERQLEKAGKAAGVPAGAAPISDATIRANAAHMQSDQVWDALSRADKQRVQRLAEPRDVMSVQEWQAMMREVLEVGGGAA